MIKVGIVGARGLSTMMGFNAIDDVRVTALCDLNEELLKAQSVKHQIDNTYRIYEDMLETDIDCVVIATPMQLHVQQTLQALNAGKHVLCEVTAGVSMDELFWLKDAVERSGKVYMFAENYNYIPENQQLNEMVKQGLFGEVYFAEGEYIHDIKSIAYLGDGKESWRKYWQLGKRGNFYPTHSVGPVMQWFKGDSIVEVSCQSTVGFTRSEFRQDDLTLTICRLASGKMIKIRLDCVSNRPHNLTYYSIQGTNGVYEAPRGMGDDHKVWFKNEKSNSDNASWEPLAAYKDYLPKRYQEATEEQIAAGHKGGDFFIVKDFVDAVKGIAPIAIDVYDACQWTAVGLLSEISATNGGKSIEMPDFRKIRSIDTLLHI